MLTPQQNPQLVGHNTPLERLKMAFDTAQMPQAIILNGPQGIGKTTFAYHIIRHALGQGAENHIAAGSHPNVLSVAPTYDEKKQRYKAELTVNEAQKITPFFRQTAVDGAWRFVVVDRAHKMNRNAQNAILKILEEPPENSTIFLVSENSGAFLPTIRSRCQMMQLDPLGEKEVINELESHFTDLSSEQINSYARLSRGSLGRAFQLIEMEAIDLASDLDQAGMHMVEGRENMALNFCEEYGYSAKDDAYRFLTKLTAQEIDQAIRVKIKGQGASLSNLQNHLITKQEKDLITMRDKVMSVFDTANASHLDRKLILFNALQAMR